jgi:hypothetical protein
MNLEAGISGYKAFSAYTGKDQLFYGKTFQVA